MQVPSRVPQWCRPRQFARTRILLLAAGASLALAPPVGAQQGPSGDTNILFPVDYIHQRLLSEQLAISDIDRTRMLQEDRSRRVTLLGQNGEPDMEAHWKPVAPPGYGFNNEPRYILAAHRLQAMFLDEADYVTAPVVLRALPLEEYRQFMPVAGPTIRGTRSVLFLLAYWIQHLTVDTVDPLDRRLLEADPRYAYHFGNANLLTHLIRHRDGNHGNMVVSMNGTNRRVFALDNDVAFRSDQSNLGDRWSRLHVDRLPASSIDRLRAITREDLERELGVVAEFEVVGGLLRPAPAGPNLRPGQGVRQQDGRVQFGLTSAEIGDVERRIAALLRDVDRGRIGTF
jgi:hypothetical protein